MTRKLKIMENVMDIKLHLVQLPEQVIRKLQICLVNLVDQQDHLLIALKSLAKLSKLEKESGKGVSEEQLFNADKDLSAGKEKIENIEELIDGMENIESAMEQYKTLADEFGMSEVVSEHMADAYDVYASAIIKHKDMMAEQELSGGIYAQITFIAT